MEVGAKLKCRGLAPYSVVLESLGLRGGGAFMSKIEKNGPSNSKNSKNAPNFIRSLNMLCF